MEVEKKNEKLVAKKQEMKVEKVPQSLNNNNNSNLSRDLEKQNPIYQQLQMSINLQLEWLIVYLLQIQQDQWMFTWKERQMQFKFKNEQVSVRFGLVCYRDHPPQELTYVTELHDLCSNREILKAIQKSDCSGGGDGAEAVLDGLNVAAQQISWRDSSKIPSLRYIFHICDQPPHGKEFGGYSELWDQTGCPCGLKPDQIIHRINMRQIHYRLIKADHTRLEKFADYFRGKVVNYDEVTLENGVADGMEIKISDMVIRELCPDILLD